MRQLIQKIDWNKLRIRNRRDWVIFWVFAALICYALGLRWDDRPNQWLFRFSNPYMTNLNQPYTWGQLLVFLGLLTIPVETVLFLCKKPVKARILVLAGALLMPAIILAGYRIHTNLIVSSLWKEKPVRIDLWKDQRMSLTGEEQGELLELCQNLTLVSDKETQELLDQWYLEHRSEAFTEADHVEIRFPEKYGHNYTFHLRVYEGNVFIWQSNTEVKFFEDNGIVEWVESITASAE